MTWLQRYRLRLYIRHSLWILPAVSIVAALIAVSLLTSYEQTAGSQIRMSPDTARIILSLVAGSTFTLAAPLDFPAGSSELLFQNEQLVPVAKLARDQPYCKLGADPGAARTVPAGKLTVGSVHHDERGIGDRKSTRLNSSH